MIKDIVAKIKYVKSLAEDLNYEQVYPNTMIKILELLEEAVSEAQSEVYAAIRREKEDYETRMRKKAYGAYICLIR